MFNTFLKQNVNFIEILFTKYKILNPKYKDIFQELLGRKEEIARINVNQALNCMAGMSKEKLKALKHPYPNIVDKIEKYGYDGKQLHHIVRMNYFIKDYVGNKSYNDCLLGNCENREYLIDIKKSVLSLEEAENLAIRLDDETYQIRKDNLTENNEINESAIELLDSVKSKILLKYFKSELLNKENKEFVPNNIFVTSDNHFYHDNIIAFENRPFQNIEDMNKKMIAKWNEVVGENDLVYILGDFSFGNAKQTNEILVQLNGHKILIIGNHDNFLESKKFDRSLFDDICDFLKINMYGQEFILCHYPLASCTDKIISLYGHLHSNNLDSSHYCNTIALKSYNVGVDVNNFMPINIKDIIKTKFSVDK
jgi:calcineurin-like phosphoesterase family protein